LIVLKQIARAASFAAINSRYDIDFENERKLTFRNI